MKNKDIQKEAKDAETQKLRRRVKRLEKENNRLKSELNSLEQAFKNTRKYIDDETKNVSVDKMIDAAKKGQKLSDLKKELQCPKCGDEINQIKSLAGIVEVCLNQECDYREVRK